MFFISPPEEVVRCNCSFNPQFFFPSKNDVLKIRLVLVSFYFSPRVVCQQCVWQRLV